MSNINKVYWCSKCVASSILPRTSFASANICNSHQRASKKQQLDWEIRRKTSTGIMQRQKTKGRTLNFLVPVSAGNEDLCPAHQLKHTLKIKSLCVKLRPPLPSDTGRKNLYNFTNVGN